MNKTDAKTLHAALRKAREIAEKNESDPKVAAILRSIEDIMIKTYKLQK